MSKLFEELDGRETPVGELYLRLWQHSPTFRPSDLDLDVYEIKLGNDFLWQTGCVSHPPAEPRLHSERIHRDS